MVLGFDYTVDQNKNVILMKFNIFFQQPRVFDFSFFLSSYRSRMKGTMNTEEAQIL